jgi:hypothetical protein
MLPAAACFETASLGLLVPDIASPGSIDISTVPAQRYAHTEVCRISSVVGRKK